MKTSVLLLVLLAACGKSATGPIIGDPTVLITNQTTSVLHFEWRDGQGTVGRDSVVGGMQRCEAFTARPDSAYFDASITDVSNGGVSIYTQPWFDPAARPAWTMLVTPTSGGPSILVQDSTGGAKPCIIMGI